jgi:putative serine protease PepD
VIGTGLVVRADGLVVTNAHVVEGAESVRVTVGGEEQTATVVAIDSDQDLALVKVDGVSWLTAVTWADSDQVVVGESVLAIGDALALGDDPSVTAGIVSGLDRTVSTDDVRLTGLIQTDAPISSGNSGGALVDYDGKVIGVTNMVAASTESVAANDVGFAIPSDAVQAFVDSYAGSV